MRRVWAVALLSLVAITWRLWLPHFLTGQSQWSTGQGQWILAHFPAIPLISLPRVVLAGLESIGLLLALGSLIRLVLCPRSGAIVTFLLVCGLTALFVGNQHRLQPWAYQAWLYAWVFTAWNTSRTCRVALTWLTASVYFYSALGKFDMQFLHTVGPDFIRFLSLDGAGSSGAAEGSATEAFNPIALLLPIVELTIAISLLIPRSRRIAGWGAFAMHLSLFLLLGPLWMNQSFAVLVWNLFLAAQAVWLFVLPGPVPDPSVASTGSLPGTTGPPSPLSLHQLLERKLRPVASAIVLLALLLPTLERLPRGQEYGYWDHWLSWSLYSPHTSRTDIQIHQSAITELPERVRRFAEPSVDDDGWLNLRIDRWSLDELSVPVYPQARFQLAVAERLSRHVPPSAIRAKVRTTSQRLTGARGETWLSGRQAIKDHTKRFLLIGS
ncbi:MAG: hypothetical protein EA381_02510 [Planctomycetaceae bacterium]|nr:MAG: hypothetical protein EA381_02510 [Planctomycetaceae bacterium]